MTNCPNCNAVLSYEGGLHCDYCGAWFERPRRSRDMGLAVRFDRNDEEIARTFARGLLTVNEVRGMNPGDWPSPPTLDTR